LYSSKTKKEVKDGLLKSVVHVITLVNINDKLRTKIPEVIDVSYSTLTNLLNSGNFKVAIKTPM
jgi:hypothetical protein